MGTSDKPISTEELLKYVAKTPGVPLCAGEYRLGRQVGRGAMGAVYIGEHETLGRRAVKVLSEQLDTEHMGELEWRFKAEVKALTRVRHENVVQIFEFGHLTDGRPYYVMELLEGRSLRSLLGPDIVMEGAGQRRRFHLQQTAVYLQQMCDGLQAAHDKGVIHRDLKPDNIFVQKGEPQQVKLLDFGIAKVLETTLPHLTQTGALGTPFYMAPEQIEGEGDQTVGPHNDIYSLGVIVYRMLSGRLPFQIPSHMPVQQAVLLPARTPPIPLAQRYPPINPAVAVAVDRCLARDPAQRPSSAHELYEAFFQAARTPSATGLPAVSAKASEDANPNPPHDRRRWLLLTLVLVLAAALSAAAIFCSA